MRKDAREYKESVIKCLVDKYGMSEIFAYKAVKQSFLYDSLQKYPEETLHDDISTNAAFVYEDYKAEEKLRM